MSKRTNGRVPLRNTANPNLNIVTADSQRQLVKGLDALLSFLVESHAREMDAQQIILDLISQGDLELTPDLESRMDALQKGLDKSVSRTNALMERTLAKVEGK